MITDEHRRLASELIVHPDLFAEGDVPETLLAQAIADAEERGPGSHLTPGSPEELSAVLEHVRDRVGVTALVQLARQQEAYCCPVGCGTGACESCPCCGAGWCVGGTDGLPETPEDFATWLEVAAEHNPLAALLHQRGDQLARGSAWLRSDVSWYSPAWSYAAGAADAVVYLKGGQPVGESFTDLIAAAGNDGLPE